ncbi:AAA family ATPase [Paenibacillus donghaensis]|uniref:AAA family ATPase n=1 Tax=Paenibacillus donghaensis TaxID=414771 RepID=UPI0018840A46|nr:AAA family ATPase [Paenibacillus donghaensis]MBE9917853.1 AAA family ATPase [Paenibacillus donghaensis]
MNNIFLPELHKIEVRNFSLYKKDIVFDFVHGINLIIGGNGLGKTTFIYLIKYGLIGLYKKELDVRTYRNEKRLYRKQYSMDYFKNRMVGEYEQNSKAEVKLTFSVNKTRFEVTRGLYDIVLKSVRVFENNESYELNGQVIRQDNFERLSDKERAAYIQGQYEELVANRSNINDFNDLIFFVNQVLFFDEDRRTIIWESVIQERLSSKYFNDPKLDELFQESKRQAKYHDSLARHKSEDMRAIRKIIKRIENEPGDKEINAINEINKLRRELESQTDKMVDTQKLRKENETKLSVYYNERNTITSKIRDLEQVIREEETQIYQKLWGTLNPKYNIYIDNIKNLHLCPMCNQELEKHKEELLVSNHDHCFLCKNSLTVEMDTPEHILELKNKLNEILIMNQNIEKEIYNLEYEMGKFDQTYNKIKRNVFDLQSQLRDFEHDLYSNKDRSEESFTYTAMMTELEELEKEKQANLELSNKFNRDADNIIKKIEGNLVKITKELSSIFANFAGDFLGMDCKLTFDTYLKDDVKMYTPVIKNKPRTDPLELSESQRFFTDQAFRMSLLRYFYTAPSFFVCETPDSSLDISYEANAAEIFLKYLQRPNSLILTSNLNNSEFMDLIIDKADKLSFLNLLEYGRTSPIQEKSERLTLISKRIEEKVNAKRIE